MPEANERFTILVMGESNAGKRVLSSLVGISSSVQVASDDESMACLTSSVDAGVKLNKEGGMEGGVEWGESNGSMEGEKAEHNLAILSLKKLRKDAAMMDGDVKVGRMEGPLRESSESSVDHSLRGLSLFSVILDR